MRRHHFKGSHLLRGHYRERGIKHRLKLKITLHPANQYSSQLHHKHMCLTGHACLFNGKRVKKTGASPVWQHLLSCKIKHIKIQKDTFAFHPTSAVERKLANIYLMCTVTFSHSLIQNRLVYLSMLCK